MDLFASIESEKDQSPIEGIGNQPTQPMAFAFSVEERQLLKDCMKKEYGTSVKDANYSDFFLLLLNRHYGN